MMMRIMIMILLLTSLQSGSSFTSYLRLITTNQIKCWLAFNEHMVAIVVTYSNVQFK